MFRLITISLLVTVGAVATSDELWNHWKRTHNKVYNGPLEEVNRRAQWERNVERIQNHNLRHDLGLVTYTLGLNQFADMSFEEFKAKYLTGLKPEPDDYSQGIPFVPDNDIFLPESVDWRDHGYVTPVKDQGECKSGWPFSATGAVEGQYKKKYGKLRSFSEQQLIDCSYPFGNEGCMDGWMEKAFDYLMENWLQDEKQYEYRGKEQMCMHDRTNARVRVTGYRTVHSGVERYLQALVARHGPVSGAIDAEDDFMLYSGGIYKNEKCTAIMINHAVLTVGYGTENGTDYWIVKNSWGTSWGEKGYVRLVRNDGNMCGIASKASVPVVKGTGD